ncbi:hypothetical protein [Aeromonas sp. HMWF016]|nr:hypothetical protein [Aeromonas sp. HMWF016]
MTSLLSGMATEHASKALKGLADLMDMVVAAVGQCCPALSG